MKFSSKRHLPVSIAAMLFTAPAFAADAIDQVPEPQPVFEQPVPQAFSWTGAYFGATLGYGWANADIVGPAATIGVDPDGIVAGGFAGYNYQFQNGMVLGGEASVDYFGVQGSAGGVDVDGEYLATIGPRLGYAFDRTLFYVEGGYARAGVDINNGAASSNADLDGYFVGVGADYAVTDNVFAGLKYDYHDFSDEGVNVGGTAYQVDGFDAHTIKARVGFKF